MSLLTTPTSHTLPRPLSPFCKLVHTSLTVLLIHRFEEVCIAFNGGKDCTVLLHLLYIALTRYLVCILTLYTVAMTTYTATLSRKGHSFPGKRIKALYITPKQSFNEIEEFVTSCSLRLVTLLYSLHYCRVIPS